MLNIKTKPYILGDLLGVEVFWWQVPALQQFCYSGVYVICDRNDRVLYVGESQDISNRLQEHRDGKEEATKNYLEYFYRVEVFRAEPVDRLINEIYFINLLTPIFNTRHVVVLTEAVRIQNRKEYLANRVAHIERSELELEAISSGCEPETQALIELFDTFKENDLYVNTTDYVSCQDWKRKYMPVILEGIRGFTRLGDEEILHQAREYAKAMDETDTRLHCNNIFHHENWGDLRAHLIGISLHKEAAYTKVPRQN
ncbi:GIY-YIG nuclease family protein [Paenibacillus sp. KR2-11]|uniref:GIY-YIG nuclease family protein n=1 Tax=Paenibacillus sp. KR2-11 TaxID=3385500 RepID=UPI0038FCC0C6